MLDKANAIKTVNQENLEFIKSRQGHDVIKKYKYSLQIENPEYKKGKINDALKIVTNKKTENINEIIASWRHNGEPLVKEKVSCGDNINLKLEKFDDMIRLNDSYEVLLNNYENMFADKPQSRAAVETVMRNPEVLQVPIDTIHTKVLDSQDEVMSNEKIQKIIGNLSANLKDLQFEMKELNINLDVVLNKKTKKSSELPRKKALKNSSNDDFHLCMLL